MTTMTYDETMAWGADQYADVLAALAAAGLAGEFTQTGGMCAALLVPLEAGYHLLITDAEDTLSWARADHAGWWAGLYTNVEGDGPIRWDQTEDGGLSALLPLIDLVLRGQQPG